MGEGRETPVSRSYLYQGYGRQGCVPLAFHYRDAARCAKEADVGKLLVGHYSSRIVDFEAYLQECKEIFPESVAVQDGDVFDF